MAQTSPYQPVLLRILHGAAAMLTTLALVSGFWVYNTYDKRWGSLPLPNLADIQGLHGTIALTFLLLLPFFALYSFHLGYHRLLQARSLRQLKQPGQPVWWIAVHHFTNAAMLLATTFAVVTGRMMKEEWLPAGEINHPWYLAHLVAWLVVLLGFAFHLLLGAKVGGVPLLLSMVNWKVYSDDRPRSWLRGLRLKSSDPILKVIEIVVISGIVLAFLLPAFNS